MGVNSHEMVSFEVGEEHAVSEVWRSDGYKFLYPRAVEGTGFRVGYALCIYIVNPTGPEHPETSRRSSKEERTVGDFVRMVVTER